MILLLKKNLRLIIYTRIIFWLPVYTIFHIGFRIEPISLDHLGNVWIAFVITATLNSSIGSLEAANSTYLTTASLPLNRRDIIQGDFLSNGFFTLLALVYTSLSAFLIDSFVPGRPAAGNGVFNPGEWIAVLTMITLIALFNSFTHQRSPALSKNALYNFSEKLLILFVCFALLPYIIVALDRKTWNLDILLEGGPIQLFNHMITILNRPEILLTGFISILILSYASLCLARYFYRRRDLK